jgi:hypothetical protein
LRPLGGSFFAIDGKWRSQLPDGREVVVQRRGAHWIVHCGSSHALAENLDVALAQAIHAETAAAGHAHEVHYPTWIRGVAEKIASDE